MSREEETLEKLAEMTRNKSEAKTGVTAKNTNTFKNRLDRFWGNQEVMFNHKCAITYKTGSRISRDEDRESDVEDQTGPVSEDILKYP